jgi:hypothetical protein
MGRKNFNREKEGTDFQKLKHENQRLKRQISALRKQIARIDIDRYYNLKEILEKHHQEDLDAYLAEEKEKTKKQWGCHSCNRGILKLKVFERRDGIFYFRKCDSCDNRTKTKKWHKDVEGIE